MRVKAVLRDSTILGMDASSKTRIVAAANKNRDRLVSLSSLLKVAGLSMDEKLTFLDNLSQVDVKIWLFNDKDQHLIFITSDDLPDVMDICGYQWQ
jgi:hypothetical protein